MIAQIQTGNGFVQIRVDSSRFVVSPSLVVRAVHAERLRAFANRIWLETDRQYAFLLYNEMV
jgi:hypothetical protein